MEKKLALLVVYNHRYDKNIPVIDKIYQNRFSHVFHLVPFYDGEQENVIPVYDSSHRFQNYIAQAYPHLRNKGFTHYLVVADDMLLNPRINEDSLWEQTGLDIHDCYISRISIIQTRTHFWTHSVKALKYKVKQPGVEISNILPSVEEAKLRFAKHGIPTTKVPFGRLIPRDGSFFNNCSVFYRKVLKEMPFSLKMDYPLVGGYSDIFLVTEKEMPKFCQYCGAFAASNLFVEIAIPTALFLTASSVKYNRDVKLKRGDIWGYNIKRFEKENNQDLNKLMDNYPEHIFFIHPVKLSRWSFSE